MRPTRRSYACLSTPMCLLPRRRACAATLELLTPSADQPLLEIHPRETSCFQQFRSDQRTHSHARGLHRSTRHHHVLQIPLRPRGLSPPRRLSFRAAPGILQPSQTGSVPFRLLQLSSTLAVADALAFLWTVAILRSLSPENAGQNVLPSAVPRLQAVSLDVTPGYARFTLRRIPPLISASLLTPPHADSSSLRCFTHRATSSPLLPGRVSAAVSLDLEVFLR